MAQEVEIKVLDIHVQQLAEKLHQLGAAKVLDTRLVVDWFRPAHEKEGEELWYLRIRTNSLGESELTWKGKSSLLGASRTHSEINLPVEDPQIMSDFLEAIGMEQYAHQEKDRISYILHEWRIEIDTYPNMPSYAEIEGKDEAHIQEALGLLGLRQNRTYSGGERKLIQDEFRLDWYEMRF